MKIEQPNLGQSKEEKIEEANSVDLLIEPKAKEEILDSENMSENATERLKREIEEETEKLAQQMEEMEKNAEQVEKTDVSKNELSFKVLGAKVKDACDKLLTKVQQMDKEEMLTYAMLSSLIAGAAIAGINVAGLEDKFHLASYIPDFLQQHPFPEHEHINAANPVTQLLEQIGIKSNPASEALAEQHPVAQMLKSWIKMDTPLKRGFGNLEFITAAGTSMGMSVGMIIKKFGSKK